MLSVPYIALFIQIYTRSRHIRTACRAATQLLPNPCCAVSRPDMKVICRSGAFCRCHMRTPTDRSGNFSCSCSVSPAFVDGFPNQIAMADLLPIIECLLPSCPPFIIHLPLSSCHGRSLRGSAKHPAGWVNFTVRGIICRIVVKSDCLDHVT